MKLKFLYLTIFALVILTVFSFSKPIKIIGNQQANYECGEPMKIDSSLMSVEFGKIYFDFKTELEPKKTKEKEFLWLANYPKGYFISYFINTSNITFKAERQDGSLMMIQEALNEKGEWSPIEFWVYSGCGNSYFNPLELEPGHCVMVPIKKYSGSFKTKIRLKMKNNSSIYYSTSFDGSIDPSQFKRESGQVNGILYHGPANYFEEE